MKEPTHKHQTEDEPISMGAASTMPVTGACCGIRPSEAAMETDFTIDFSKAKQFLVEGRAEDASE